MARSKSGATSVLHPNFGVYFNVPPIEVPKQGLSACRNVRIDNGTLTNRGVGWGRYSEDWALNGPITLVDTHLTTAGVQKLILATFTDIYEWVEANDTVRFLTPRYSTGTVTCAGTTAVTGSGTTWTTNAKAGDYISFSNAAQRDPNATWYRIASVTDNTHLVLQSAGPSVTGVAYTIRRTLTMAAGGVWSTDLYHNAPGPADYWIGTNGSDPVMSWDGSATQVTLQSGFGFTCKALRRWSNMMIYANLNVGGTRRRTSVHNSAIGDPFNVTTLEAAEFIAYGGVDEILLMLPMADYLVLYSSAAVVMTSLVGGDSLFAFRVAVNDRGPIAPGAVADHGDRHVFMSTDGAYSFDGVGTTEVYPQVMREIIRRAPVDRWHQISAHFYEENGQVVWVVPQTSDMGAYPETAYTEHYLEVMPKYVPTPFTIQDLPAVSIGYFERITTLTWNNVAGTWAEQTYRWDDRFFSGNYPMTLFGAADGNLYVLGSSDTQAGAPVSSYALFGLQASVDGTRRGCVTRVIPFAQQEEGATYALKIKVHTTMQVGGTPVESQEYSYDLTQLGDRFVNPYQVGRFFAVEFGTNGLAQTWTLQGYSTEVRAVGER